MLHQKYVWSIFCSLLVLAIGLWGVPWLNAQETVKINEVAWAGTEASSSDEYIELAGPVKTDLNGWRLEAIDGTPGITLTGVISASGFYLLERTDDNTVASRVADQIYAGALQDNGEHLQLKNSQGQIIDEINAAVGWPAGDNSPQRAAMERFGAEFLTNDCTNTSGALDADSNTICGTPGAENQQPQTISTVRFVRYPASVAKGSTTPFVAQAWNSAGQPPEGSTMQFSIVSTGTEIITVAPLTATINANGQATVTITGLSTGKAIIAAQWFGNSGGVEVVVGENNIYLPIVIKD